MEEKKRPSLSTEGEEGERADTWGAQRQNRKNRIQGGEYVKRERGDTDKKY